MDAVERLQKMTTINELTCERIACKVMQLAYIISNSMCTEFKKNAKAILSQPVKCAAIMTDIQGNDDTVSYDVMLNTVLKRTSHNCDISPIIKGIIRDMEKRFKGGNLADWEVVEEALSEFIDSCARLAWGLVVQTPPLTLEFNDKPVYNPNQHQLSGIKSESIKPDTVLVYIWPVLREQDNGRVVCKGILTKNGEIGKIKKT
uniref:Mitochondria-eating protein n=1 Tax=Saccoglossus kowalevskii TaxID=10224 RepID=A0ABM0MDG5_SACKO|nr:PREDICTED: uncharacterized protein LOC102807621 [Saccoglossus kowalevskii]